MATGWPMKTTYVDGDVYSASDVNDITGTVNLLGSSVAYTAGKNVVLNGAFQIWQRGTTSSGNAYLADRWYGSLVSGTGTFAQESTVITTVSPYTMKFTASATAQPALYQAIDGFNTARYAGQTVTISAKVASSTSVGFTADVQYSTSFDNGVAGSWTSITATSGGTATATSTTFVTISGVYAIPSTAKSLRVRLFTTSTIASSVVVYFGQVQLEQGSTVTAYQTATGNIASELAACQRYWAQSYDPGVAAGTATSTGAMQMIVPSAGTGSYYIPVRFPVAMRTTPTVTAYDNAGTSGRVYKDTAGAVAVINNTGNNGCSIGTENATNARQLLFSWTASAEL